MTKRFPCFSFSSLLNSLPKLLAKPKFIAYVFCTASLFAAAPLEQVNAQDANVQDAGQIKQSATAINSIKDSSSIVGTLQGKFTVTKDGAAMYSIPIDVPPGTAGMTPVLPFVDNGQQQQHYNTTN